MTAPVVEPPRGTSGVTGPREPLVAFALTVAAVAGWWATFDGVAWLLVGALGAALGTLVVVLHAWRHTLAWALVTVPLAYLLLGVGVLGVEFAGSGAPRAETLTRVISGAWECWPLLVGTHPPVEATGAVLLAPAISGVVIASLSTALAIASRRPGWPAVPLLALLAGVLVTGSHSPSDPGSAGASAGVSAGVSAGLSVGLLGAAYGLACVVWAVVRAGRDTSGAVRARWPVAVPVLVVCTLLAVPLGGSLLGEERDRLVLREETAAYGVAAVVTPLDAFRRYRKQPDLPDNAWRRQLLRVTSPGDPSGEAVPPGTVLRFTVLNRYDGTRWVAANDVEPGSHDDRFQLFSADYLTTDEALGTAPVRIDLTGAWNSQWVPLAGRLVGLNTDFPGSVPVTDLRVNPVTSTALAIRTLGGGDRYEFFYEPVDTVLPRDAEPSPLLDRETYAAAEVADTWARAALAELDDRADSRIDAVMRAAAMLKKRGRYSDGAFGWEVRFARGQDRARLDEFLNGSYTVGNDEQYAAAMALVATRLEVPARVVVGARVPPDGIVKGNDVIAWVELRIDGPDGGSWRELPRATYMSFREPRQDDPPQKPVVVPPEPPAPEPEPPQPPQTESPDDPEEEPAEDEDLAARSGAWPWWLLLLLTPGAVPALKQLRRARRRRTPRLTLRYAGAWQELVDRGRDLGLPVPPRRSRPAQSAALGDGTLDLARGADDAVFGAAPPSPEAAEGYWQAVLARRTELGSGLPAWRRWWAPFNPASLRRS